MIREGRTDYRLPPRAFTGLTNSGSVRVAGRRSRSQHPGRIVAVMGTEGADRQQQKVREFMSLLPLTLELAGLPHAEPGRYYSESQMDARATTIRTAYKIARQIVLEVAK
jgi:hypothetical protein